PDDRSSALFRVDRALELALAHPRAAFHAELFRLVVELFARAPARTGRARAFAAAAARRGASRRAARARLRFAAARAFLVDGPRGDLLGPFGRAALFLLRVLDVLV